MEAVLAGIAPAFRDHPHDSQKVFRLALEAMARPARFLEADFAGLFPAPPPLDPAAAALILTLCDHDTGLYLSPSLAGAAGYFSFHTGARPCHPSEAAFAVAGDLSEAPPLDALGWGDEACPDLGATLVICCLPGGGGAVPPGMALRASGPGLGTPLEFAGHGLTEAFVGERELMRACYPQGVDVFLTGGSLICALPRTTALERSRQGGRGRMRVAAKAGGGQGGRGSAGEHRRSGQGGEGDCT